MKTKITRFFLIILFFLAGCSPPPQTNPVNVVDQIFAPWDHDNTPGCVMGVIQNGRWAYQHAYGMADLEAKTPITTQNAFYIGSMAKQFTAMSILLLAEQGKLSLTDDIRKYLPEMPDYGTPITIQNLVHHTSGIKDLYELISQKYAGQTVNETELAASFQDNDVLELIAGQKTLDFAPGDQYTYSNSNYILLGMIVKRVSGKSLRQFADENIFKPLGMTHTQFKDDAKIVIPNLALGYRLNPDGRWESRQDIMQAWHFYGDGGLYTTLDDLFKWDQNFYQIRLGEKSPRLIDQMLSTQPLINGGSNNYAFGQVITEYRGLTEIEHGGGCQGYSSDMARFPEKNLTVIELCNFSYDQNKPQELTPQVAELFWGE